MENHFNQDVAARYDLEHTGAGDLDSCARFLADLAGGGRVLEFAIGTGRVALALTAKGLEVHGNELSEAMVKQLRAKPGGADIPVVIGDMTSAKSDGLFALVALVFNTICNLTSQDQQTECFRNAAEHLEPGGHFVIETFMPKLQQLPFGETLLALSATETHQGMDEIDVATQQFTSHHIWVREDETIKRSIPFRYVWPSELDLMAKLAGLELVERWQDWDRTAFSNTSTRHISVWQKPSP